MAVSEKDLSLLDFGSTSSYCIQFPAHISTDSRVTFTDVEWSDYCPEVFRDLRELQEINEDDYVVSIRSHETLRQLIASKKNGTHLQLSHDKKFVVKIIAKNDMKVLLHILPKYYRHLQTYRNTLLPNFLGLHMVKPLGGQKIRFVIMEHKLQSDLGIHKQFNCKTLHHGRHISRAGWEEDLSIGFHLHTLARSQLLGQIKADCEFLEEEGIIDYGLLIGMHVCPTPFDAVVKGSNDVKKKPSDGESSNESNSDQDLTCDGDSQPSSQIEPDDKLGKLGLRMPARAVDIRRLDGGGGLYRRSHKEEKNNVILFMGIADILQGYGVLKRVEHVFKSLQYDTPSISGSNPKAYSIRFQELLCTLFPENL
ncbi:phosphatidylinositol 4-phosphate 5-kinase 10-like [Ananas comosus]|uniref:1-phosphatidylinositol-4-phosphate 5-kinase n=2 Tax=Ananas comosus TaxID=4615 RepID=A0A6P5EVN9_ANACO|nr:phosphatidylinositol 4-phosphate 5-kinase 10-like [Ananas comosus]